MTGDDGLDYALVKSQIKRELPNAQMVVLGAPDLNNLVAISTVNFGPAGFGLWFQPDAPDLVGEREGESDEERIARLKADPRPSVMLAFMHPFDTANFLNLLAGSLGHYAREFAEPGDDVLEWEQEQVGIMRSENLTLKRQVRALLRALADGDRPAAFRVLRVLRDLAGHSPATYSESDVQRAAATAVEATP